MKKLILYTCILIVTIVFFCCDINKTFAKLPGEGLTISPPISELTLLPGQSSENIIKINNPTSSIVEVYPKVMNFSSRGENGDPTFSSATDEGQQYSLANWISFSDAKLALTPEQDIEFKYTISVPTNAEPGGHYGVVFFVSEPPEVSESQTQVAISSMLGSLILVKVPGDIKEELILREFSSNVFYLKMPANLTTRIENIGNIHLKPRGDIVIKNMFGSQKTTLDVNPKKGNILPESIRRFDTDFSGSKFSIGRYSANLNVQYGEGNKTLSGKLTFWVIPWWFIVIFVLVITLIIILIVRARKKKERRMPPPNIPPPPVRQRIVLR